MNIFAAGADVGELEESYVLDALRSGWYENKYYYVEEFEKKFSQYHGRQYGLMTTNCTHALHLLLEGLGISYGDEVIAPECTWIASIIGAHKLGAKLVFCDIDKDNWCISPDSVRKNITNKTKAIIVVNLYGNMASWEELEKISKEFNIPIIEDAAEALGSTLNGKRAGSFGIGSTFSFHNTKTITTGEGGMLLLDDEELYNKCVKIRDLGRGPNTKPYFNEIVGEKFIPSNIQAALGVAQFSRIDELINTQRKHFKFYKDNLSELDIIFNYEPSNVYNSAWITTILTPIDKHELIKKLEQVGIPSRPFFYPLSSLPPFKEKENNNAYSISKKGVNLPGAANLTESQLSYICENVKKILGDYSC